MRRFFGLGRSSRMATPTTVWPAAVIARGQVERHEQEGADGEEERQEPVGPEKPVEGSHWSPHLLSIASRTIHP
jgi:hypothetical protein